MKSFMKRTIFVMIMLSSIIVAVSANGKEEEQSSVSKSTDLVFWCTDYINTALADVEAKFLAEHPGVTITNEVIGPADLYQKFLLAVTAGTGIPDIIALESSHLAKYVQIGALYDITAQTKPYMSKMNSYKWLDASKDGKVFAMPMDSGPVAMYYRRDIFEKAGLPSSPEEVTKLLATWEDYYQVAKIIKDKTGVYMFADSTEQPALRNFEKLMFQRGAWYFDTKGNITINTSKVKEILEYLKKFIDNDLMENAVEWSQPWYDSFSQGTVATHFGAVWMSGFLKGWIAPDTAGLWGIVPLPVWEKGGSTTANDGGSTLAIPAGSSNPDLAWEFIEYALGNVESQISQSEKVDQFPSLIGAYSSDYFTAKDPFYKDQQALKVFTDTIKTAPNVAYTQNYALGNEIFQSIFLRYIYGEYTVDQALQEAETQIKERMTE